MCVCVWGGCLPQLRAQSSGRFVPARLGPVRCRYPGRGARGGARRCTKPHSRAARGGGSAEPGCRGASPGVGGARGRHQAAPHLGSAPSQCGHLRGTPVREGGFPPGSAPPAQPHCFEGTPGCMRPPLGTPAPWLVCERDVGQGEGMESPAAFGGGFAFLPRKSC